MANDQMTSQKALILRDLVNGKRLTAFDAIKKYRCLRLASRIFDLREDGWIIDIETISKKICGKHISYAQYAIDPRKNPIKHTAYLALQQVRSKHAKQRKG